jgi:hypothetical protein
MPSADLLFSLREKLLDILSGSDRARSLNPSTDPSLRSGLQLRTSQITAPNVDSIDEGPATELIELLHEVLSSELADHGATLDYSALRQSLLYDDFRQCAGKLRTSIHLLFQIGTRSWHFGSIYIIHSYWMQ